MASCPQPDVINVFEKPSSNDIQHLAPHFSLDRITIDYIPLSHQELTFSVPPQAAYFAFVVNGSGKLRVGEESGDLKEWDCFGFPPSAAALEYGITPLKSGVSLFIVCDKAGTRETANKSASLFPAIVHARDNLKPAAIGHFFRHTARLAELCNIWSEDPKNIPWNVNLQSFPPGTKTSHAHAHSLEDELAFMLKGSARYWHQGTVPEPILKAGDCVGWKAGTGVSHNIINDGDGPNGEGQAFSYLIWGDNLEGDDQCFYPDRTDGRQPENHKWLTYPNIPWGPASKDPKFPRADDSTE